MIDLTLFDVGNAINRWCEELDKNEVFLTEGICSEFMDQFEYFQNKPESDWISAMRLFAHDDRITEIFRRWVLKGEGIEAFPTDPLNPINWENPKEI